MQLEMRSPATEAVHDATRDLDRRSVAEIVEAVHAEDQNAWLAVGKVLSTIAEAADVLACVLDSGGRWFNVGAGTSGRMGALDAAEIPPTFGVPPGRVQAVIAGGIPALIRAVEGAEDDTEAGAAELRARSLAPGDVVVALSASGTTPFTLGCLEAARAVGAHTVGISCDAGSPLARGADISISPEVGPEVIAGSTRMKGGLAQKMVLHLLSTTALVRLGCVSGNLMTRVRPVSRKLRDRGERIVMTVAGVGRAEAVRLLERTEGDIARAVELSGR